MRAVWVLDKSFVPLWSRRFPTVEARFRAAHAGLRYELLDEADVAAVVRRCVEAHRPSEALVPLLEPREVHLRPLLFVECALGLVVGLVLLGAESHQRSGMGSTAPEVALALDTLCQLASFLDAQAVAQQQSSGSGFWASIGMAVSAVMPFGLLVRPLHAGAALAGAGARGAEDSQPDADGPDNKSAAGGARVPAWRVHDAAIPNKKSRVLICIEETVESHQYDRAGGGGDAGKLSGRVTLWSDHAANPPGSALEVSLKVLMPASSGDDQNAELSCDPCVSVFTVTGATATKHKVVHLTVAPALKLAHTILRYSAPPPTTMPWRAFYQMKPGPGPREAKVLIQLKLSDAVTNNFATCSVSIPFGSTGGAVESFEVSPTEGQVKSSPSDPATLVWELGTTIVGRKLECALPMTVRFVDDTISSNARWSCFADMSFRVINGPSLSGLHVGAEDVVLSPKPSGGGPTVSVTATVTSGVYRIWNSLAGH